MPHLGHTANRCAQGLLALLGAVLAAAGCTGLSGGESLPTDCIISRSIQDYARLDSQNLIIYGPGGRGYHVVLTTPSNNIQSEYQIGVLDAPSGVTSGDGRICPYGGDAILIDGPIAERIPIRSIEMLDAAALEALRVEFGLEEAAEEDLVTGTVIQ